MKRLFGLAACFSAALFAASSPVRAGSATATLPITIQAPLQIVFTPASATIACNAAPGAVLAAVSVTGGDGNPVTFTATGGDTADFAVVGSNVVVGSNGIAAANCGKTMNFAVSGSQP